MTSQAQIVTDSSKLDVAQGMAGSLSWQYNHPINVPQFYSAVCRETTQNETSVSVQNLSATFDVTFFISGGGISETVVLKANNPTPWQTVKNFNGSKLRIANISQESAAFRATLIDLS